MTIKGSSPAYMSDLHFESCYVSSDWICFPRRAMCVDVIPWSDHALISLGEHKYITPVSVHYGRGFPLPLEG